MLKSALRAALKYLGCTDLSTISLEEQRTKAYLLSIAALLGKDVYNFGELLAHSGN
jgi:26S proteasome regulatory subunit N9